MSNCTPSIPSAAVAPTGLDPAKVVTTGRSPACLPQLGMAGTGGAVARLHLRDNLARLQIALGAVPMAHQVSLAGLSRWRIGGQCPLMVTPRDAGELARVLSLLSDLEVPFVVVGDMTNLLFDDRGVDAVIVRVGPGLRDLRETGTGEVEAGAGWWVPALVRQLVARGRGGLEHAVGIPGTLGGLVAMNGGSQRRCIGENVTSVTALRRDGSRVVLDHTALAFSYRDSRLLHNSGLVAVSVTLRLARTQAAKHRREALAILAARRRKFPRVHANCGSVFVSDPADFERGGPPGVLIEGAGLKGHRCGGAEISPVHANFIVNNGGATARDVLTLIGVARERVYAAAGIRLRCEVRYVRCDGSIVPAHYALSEHHLD